MCVCVCGGGGGGVGVGGGGGGSVGVAVGVDVLVCVYMCVLAAIGSKLSARDNVRHPDNFRIKFNGMWTNFVLIGGFVRI